MNGIRFEKVSFEQFKKDVINCGFTNWPQNDDELKAIYDSIKLPTRATSGSAGYDIILPYEIRLRKNEPITIPTGIKAVMPENTVLMIVPRSGQGFKYGLSLANTIGVIDSDYAFSDNEGHIMLKIFHKYGEFVLELEGGKGFAQGIFTQYCVTDDDAVTNSRNGGFGSTDKLKG